MTNTPNTSHKALTGSGEADSPQMQEDIASGAYFEEARDWYARIYLAPIAQRVFYLFLTGICLLIFIFSLLAITSLLPIAEVRPFLYASDTQSMMDNRTSIVALRRDREPINDSLQRFYLSEFVSRYEAYNEKEFNTRRGFIYNYADPALFKAYDRQVNPANTKSPLRVYGKFVTVDIDIREVRHIPDVTPLRAQVYYTRTVKGRQERESTYHVATIEYSWEDLVEENYKDADKDEYILDLSGPVFKVTSYQTQPQQRVAR